MTTAVGPEMPGPRPSLGQQVAALAARMARRDPPASIGRQPTDERTSPAARFEVLDATSVSGVQQPPDGGLVRLPDTARAPLDQWDEFLSTFVDTLNARRPDPSVGATVSVLQLARAVLDQATILARPAPNRHHIVRPGSRDQLAELFTQVGYLHAAIGELLAAMLMQLGSLHDLARDGEVIAPPGADAFAEIEAVIRDVLALQNNIRENTSRADHGGYRFTRLSWPSE